MNKMTTECASSVSWSGAKLSPEGNQISLDRLSFYNCSEGRTWSAWADGSNLVQGFVTFDNDDATRVFQLPTNNDASTEERMHDLFFRLLGPSLSLVLCVLSFVHLYRRRNDTYFRGDHNIPLAQHPHVPLSARIAVPILLFSTIGLFAFSNASIGAQVTLGVQSFDRTLFQTSLFDFSLINTVQDMWEAGVYSLSLLVAIWSGIWPYLKCMLMFAAWFFPPSTLKPAHRRRLLISLDILGKWALLDLFLMNMMSIAFRFHIIAATIHFIPKNLVAVDVKVTPQYGLFTFVTAVALSLVVNHTILLFHRNIVSAEEVDDGRRGSSFRSPSISLSSSGASANVHTSLLERGEIIVDGEFSDLNIHIPKRYCVNFPEGSWFDAGSKEALESKHKGALRIAFSHISLANYQFPSDGVVPSILLDKRTRSLRVSLRLFLVFGSLLVFSLIIACATEDTFQFVFTGLAGELIKEIDPEQQHRRASLLSIAEDLGKDKEKSHVFGVFYLQSLYLLFAFIFPLVMLFMSVIMMFGRFTLRQAKLFFYALEVVSAWAALDVFIVAIIASVMQINQFSHFLGGAYCEAVEKDLHVKECFGVETQLLKGCWLIVAASSLLWCYVQFVQRTAERGIADREEKAIEIISS